MLSEPELADAHFPLGLVALRTSDNEAAIVALERDLYLDPEHRPAQYNLGLAYARVGRMPDSIAALQTFAALRNHDLDRRRHALLAGSEAPAEALYREATAALALGDAASAASAARHYSSALNLAGINATAMMALGLGAALHALQDQRAALEALEQAISLDPKLAEAYRLLGDVNELLGDTAASEAARSRYHRLLEPRRGELRLLKAVRS